jgi:hypothetical protein
MQLKSPLYDKTPDQEILEGLPASSWGKFTRYLEIAEDRYANRQVDWFENGYALRYDREHYVDEFGKLADLRYSRKWHRWWPNSIPIDRAEFENVWSNAAHTPAEPLQTQSKEASSWPAVPPWLAHQ